VTGGSFAFAVDAAHQRAFARLSGDSNPIHLDAIEARRTLVGVPIVHGMHAVLILLDSELLRMPRALRAGVAISATFQHPMLVGETVRTHRRRSGSTTTLALENAFGKRLLDLEIRPATIGASTAGQPIVAEASGSTTPAERTIAGCAGASGAVFIRRSGFASRFPAAVHALGADVVASLAGLSRVVGMECPGRDSLLSAVRVSLRPLGRAGTLQWRVVRVDPRFGVARLDVGNECVEGTVDAFVRRPAAALPAFEAAAARVGRADFAGQRALIVGGSRGLGAATALLVAGGGGSAMITYASGTMEARALQAEARRYGRRIEAAHFDVTAPDTSALRRLVTRFRPTHLYYFATPRIFFRRRDDFDADLFERFSAFYVTHFAAVAEAAGAARPLSIFFPSSAAVDDARPEWMEYAAAKAAGEALCAALQAAHPAGRIVVRRLPRTATDQTASIVRVASADPLDVMLEVVREMHAEGPARR
jgi:NAD(P)-dependent dehydrogenase (short-subunit alcohol dehydrogenase family)